MKKYIQPILVTLSIILVCGFLLAVLSDLLFVDDKTRINRAINNIYSSEQTPPTLDGDPVDVNSVDMSEFKDIGEIKACYKLTNGDYLVLSVGKKGYSNGTVTTYVAITSELVVRKVVQNDYKGQTLMGKFSQDYYNKFTDKTTADQKDSFDGIISTGATYSSNAISNSVYVALKFTQRIGG